MKKTNLFRSGLWALSLAALVLASCAGAPTPPPAAPAVMEIISADPVSASELRIRMNSAPEDLSTVVFTLQPVEAVATRAERRSGGLIHVFFDVKLELGTAYSLAFAHAATEASGSFTVNLTNLQEAVFNGMYSDKRLGYAFEGGQSVFRLFVPRGKTVELHIYDRYDDPIERARIVPMTADENMVFEASVPGALWGKYYGYRITERLAEPVRKPTAGVPLDTVFGDPYGRVTVSSNTYPQISRTLIFDDSRYNWGNSPRPGIDPHDLIIMETHVRDASAHPTAGVTGLANPGSFKGFQNATRGGLKYMSELGVNAVEFLPLHDFAEVEMPFRVMQPNGKRNDWNAYGRNYWGYMTTNFFSLEAYYGSDGTQDPTKWNGTDGRVLNEFKDLVKAMHARGIAVLNDVVYNHLSIYDANALQIIDGDFYIKKREFSGFGSEVETRRRMVRRMVLDSLQYQYEHLRIDGFRFDLAGSHDQETVKAIFDWAQTLNPKPYLIAEPWGGERLTSGSDFLKIGWAKWSTGLRDTVRSVNRPTREGRVLPLGNNNNASALEAMWIGAAESEGRSWQGVHYIESHDDTTFGDNLRIQSGFYKFTNPDRSINRIPDIAEYQRLTPFLLEANKIGAMTLFLSQGPVMMHFGQEWARGKVTPNLEGTGVQEVTNRGALGSASDNVVGMTPAPNSYSADNETNWINFDHAELNRSLIDFYKGLIALRKQEPMLGRAQVADVTILKAPGNANALGTNIQGRIFGFLNADLAKTAEFSVPEGSYGVYVDGTRAGTAELAVVQGPTITLQPRQTMIVIKK